MNITSRLKEIEDKGLKRELLFIEQAGVRFQYKEKECLNFSSNDYLDLSTDLRVKEVAKTSIDKWGIGATGSRLMSGSLQPHKLLEQKIAQWIGYESALVFGSGFLTNLGVISTICKKEDLVLFDRLNHASLIDGVRMSEAKWKRYKHKDLRDLEKLLEKYKDVKGRIFVVTDSVFSMDGDIAPVREISELTKKYNAFLIVDEAHAIGVFGKNGAGVCNEQNIRPDIITETLSKALGGYGGFAVCSFQIKQLFINKARSFIYSTALPPVCLDAGIKAIEIIEKEGSLGAKALKQAKFFHEQLKTAGFKLLPFESLIIPVFVGDNEKVVEFSQELFEKGVFVKAIRPPTVPIGTSRIRISVGLGHKKKALEKALSTIIKVSKKMEII